MSVRARSLHPLPAALTLSALIAGVLGVIVALYVPNAYDKTIPPFVVVGALLGTYVYGEDLAFDDAAVDRDWVVVGYFLLAGVAVFAYSAGFERTLLVDASLIGLFLLSAVGVFAFESAAGKLALPILTALLQRSFIYYSSATQLGLDALFHNRAAEAIGATGTMEALSLSKYWYTSGYHLLTATGTSVFGVPVRDAAFVVVTLVMVFVAAVGVFAIVNRSWGETIGALGALLFLVADKAVYTAVHTTPTTLGLVFFVLLVLVTPAYLATGKTRYVGAFTLLLAGVAFTHQFSLFVIVVSVGPLALVYSVWDGDGGWVRPRLLFVEVMLVVTLLAQSVVTRYGGPASDTSQSFFATVTTDIVGAIGASLMGHGPVAEPPPGMVLSGAGALDVVQVLGKGILFCFALVGAIYWLSRRNSEDERTVIAIGATVVTMTAIVFGGGLLGVSVFLPRRWFVFLVVPLAVLAAPGVLALSSSLSPSRKHAVTVVLVLLAITAPYVVFMYGNGVGSPDDPLFDEAPGAARITTTTTEAATYGFVDAHAGDATVVADHLAWQVIDRHYGQPAVTYTTEYGADGTTFAGEQLLVHRAYASTNHVSYVVMYEGRPYRVFGPLPEPVAGDGVVYVAGEDRVVYRPG